jgi:sulfur-carrier protein
MPIVWIPSLIRDLTGGQQTVTVEGATVRQVVRELEARFPGIAARLCEDAEDGELSPHINVAVDGVVSPLGMLEPVGPESEVHFLPAVGGGVADLTPGPSPYRRRETRPLNARRERHGVEGGRLTR